MSEKTNRNIIATEEIDKKKDIEKLNSIYENLSETGKIMMMTYSTAISDMELTQKNE